MGYHKIAKTVRVCSANAYITADGTPTYRTQVATEHL
jgi:hypothetical protein